MILTEKETTFLKDFKSQEQLCIDKYNKYSTQACNQGLKDLFSTIEKTEQQHLDSVTQMMSGTVPNVNSSNKEQGGQSTTADSMLNSSKAAYNEQDKKEDTFLCQDALANEKHVSSVYNTGIFEFKNEDMRQVLNHIQKEEQHHGKMIYDYMSQNGMYN